MFGGVLGIAIELIGLAIGVGIGLLLIIWDEYQSYLRPWLGICITVVAVIYLSTFVQKSFGFGSVGRHWGTCFGIIVGLTVGLVGSKSFRRHIGVLPSFLGIAFLAVWFMDWLFVLHIPPLLNLPATATARWLYIGLSLIGLSAVLQGLAAFVGSFIGWRIPDDAHQDFLMPWLLVLFIAALGSLALYLAHRHAALLDWACWWGAAVAGPWALYEACRNIQFRDRMSLLPVVAGLVMVAFGAADWGLNVGLPPLMREGWIKPGLLLLALGISLELLTRILDFVTRRLRPMEAQPSTPGVRL